MLNEELLNKDMLNYLTSLVVNGKLTYQHAQQVIILEISRIIGLQTRTVVHSVYISYLLTDYFGLSV